MKLHFSRNTRDRFVSAFAVFLYLVFWLAIALVSWHFYRADEQSEKERIEAERAAFISDSTTSPTMLRILLLVKSIDHVSASVKVGLLVGPSEDLVRKFETGRRLVGSVGAVGTGVQDLVIDDPAKLALVATLNRPVMARGVAVMVRGFRKEFPAGSRLPKEDTFTLPLTTSSVLEYPSDTYSGFLDVSASLLPDPASSTPSSSPLQIQVFIDNAARGFNYASGSPSTPQGKARGPFFVEAEFTLQRGLITIGFSNFIIAILWILSVAIGFLALQVVALRRPVKSGLLVPPISLLFALPNLRNVQPQAPPVGSAVDVIGFFWNMAIVALSAVAITYAFIDRWTPPEPKRKQQEAEPLILAS